MDTGAINKSVPSDFKLGDWWVRPQRNELERSTDTVHVEARSMAVLVCLGHHAPGVVTKERLLEEVWSDSPYVGDDVISHAIWELRKALGDSARDPQYIQTVPRKGYRLVAEVLRPQGSPLPLEGVRIDHYDLGEEIGRGSMGVVFKAVDRRLGRTVAIKFLAPELTRDPKACQRFEREARLAASLDHPNLATVHEIGETSDGHRYLVNTFYRGGSLKDRLAAGNVEAKEALRLVRQLVAGLGAAHRRDIVHRDIKPANLLLDEHGTLKICDFGIAKLLGTTDLTHTGAILGTPAYKSPEQAQGHIVDHRTDLWAAGVVFYELLTGRRPFDGEYEQAVVRSILFRKPRIPEGAHGRPVAEPLRSFIDRALAKEPGRRFQSAEEMTLALDEIETGSPLRTTNSKGWLAAAVGFATVFLALWGLSEQRPGWSSLEPGPPDVDPRSIIREIPGSSDEKGLDGNLFLSQGRKRWLRGNSPENLAAARDQFEEAVRLMPQSSQALGHLAVFLAERYFIDKKSEDRGAALELAQKAKDQDPHSALARVAEARIYLTGEESEKAEALAREAIGYEPTCARDESCDLAYRCLADSLWLQGRFEETWKILEQCVQVGGGYIRCGLKRAQLYDKAGKKKLAEKEYLTVLRLDTTQTTALNDYSIFLLKDERWRDAVTRLLELLDHTEDPDVFNNLGYARYAMMLWDEAARSYAAAHTGYLRLGIKKATPLVNLGDIEMERNQSEKAKEFYLAALEIFDSDSELRPIPRARRAVCLAKLGRFLEAENEIEKVFHHAGKYPELIALDARIQALQGNRTRLMDLVRQGRAAGLPPTSFLADAAFIPYRTDVEYLRVADPEMYPSE